MSAFSAKYSKHILNFKQPSGTSRGILRNKDSWFIYLSEKDNPDYYGIGECSLIHGLSPDAQPKFENILRACCQEIESTGNVDPKKHTLYPAIRFGLETALLDLEMKQNRVLFSSDFTAGLDTIPINGLVWMGDAAFMKKQIHQKLEMGFSCLKLKIGAIDFEEELRLLKSIRKNFSPEELELRVDANGAFSPANAMEKLKRLAEYGLHSIEQPIASGQYEEMARICNSSPLAIALDEELIGINSLEDKISLLEEINPQFIILKPSLVGGFFSAGEWIDAAKDRNIGWWVTSALESNLGLNAISQWTYTLDSVMPQGLGTGQLYTNNFNSPLYIEGGRLGYNPELFWGLPEITDNQI